VAEFFRNLYADGSRLFLFWDQYPAHLKPEVFERGRELGIKIALIPGGGTSLCQPLDRRVFGVMKSTGARIWRKMYKEDAGRKFGDDIAAQIALASYKQITQEVILDAWDLGIPDESQWERDEDSPEKYGPGIVSYQAKDTKSGTIFRIIETRQLV
jgi:hypothetical protein